MTAVDHDFETMLPDTPAGRAAAWAMSHVIGRGADLTADEARARHGGPAFPTDVDFADFHSGYARVGDQLGDGFTVAEVDDTQPDRIHAILVSQSGRRWEWAVAVAPEPPHRIVDMLFRRALPPGVEVRQARAEDGPALSEVARRAPIRLTDASITIDAGDDYFAGFRLMGDTAVTYVATHEGRPIGIHCGVSYDGRLDGVDGRFCLISHSRMLPEFSGGGIWGRLNETVIQHFQARGGRDVGLAYVRPDNANAQRLGGAESRWPTRVFRAVLDCAALAGPAVGRAATAADSPRVVELVDAAHAGEEFFRPYTDGRLATRLTRAPELYTWPDLLLSERAVVGVWASGETHTLVPEGGETVVSRRATVIDYGFEPGAEDELDGLLRSWCGRLVTAGITHLGVFSSPASRGADRLRHLAATVEEFDVMPPGVPETETASRSGIYVDPVYF